MGTGVLPVSQDVVIPMPEKILFVDDEPQVLEGFRRLLHGRFQVDTALSAAEALAKLKRNGPYAVAVCDMRMPEMDGLVLLTKIKIEFPEVVRIMLTGNSDQQTAMQAVNEGNVFRFLAKPCDEELLTKSLNAALVEYRLANYQEELVDKAIADHPVGPTVRHFAGFKKVEEKVREILPGETVTRLPTDFGAYFGKVIWEDAEHLLQCLSPTRVIAHPKNRLSRIPPVGEFVKIEYNNGLGEIANIKP